MKRYARSTFSVLNEVSKRNAREPDQDGKTLESCKARWPTPWFDFASLPEAASIAAPIRAPGKSVLQPPLTRVAMRDLATGEAFIAERSASMSPAFAAPYGEPSKARWPMVWFKSPQVISVAASECSIDMSRKFKQDTIEECAQHLERSARDNPDLSDVEFLTAQLRRLKEAL